MLIRILFIMLFLALPSAARANLDHDGDDEHKISELASADYISGIFFPGLFGTGDLTEIPYVLEIMLTDQWYTYWRMAGDSGLPPTLDWSASENVKDVKFYWPAPRRFEQDGFNSFGYDGKVTFPVTIIPQTPGKAVNLRLTMNAVVCHEICVPQTLNIFHETPVGPPAESPYFDYIKETMAALPSRDGTDDLQLETAVAGKNALVVTASAKNGFEDYDVFVEAPDLFLTAKPELQAAVGEGGKAVFKIAAPEDSGDLTEILFGKTVTVTLVNRGKAVEKEFTF